MSLNYIITSPAVISGPSSSELFFQLGGDSINLRAPTGLSSTYEFVLPSTLGTQSQILTLNSSLETEWVDNSTGEIQTFSITDSIDFSGSNTNYIPIPSMILTPPAGTYYCIFSSQGGKELDYAFAVDNVIVLDSVRKVLIGTPQPKDDNLLTIASLTVDGTEDITVQSKRSNLSSPNYDIRNRTLIIYEVI